MGIKQKDANILLNQPTENTFISLSRPIKTNMSWIYNLVQIVSHNSNNMSEVYNLLVKLCIGNWLDLTHSLDLARVVTESKDKR
jgi:hypothetical protein